MTKRKNGTVKQHPPPQQLASRSDLVRRPLTSILAFILLAALSAMQSDLLNPLFSATDSLPNSRALALGTLPAILLRGVMSNESTKAGWVAPFAIIGICLIFSELAVRWGGLWLMQQGFGRGRWIAIAALRGPPLLAASLWLARDPATSSADSVGGEVSALLNALRLLLLIRLEVQPRWLSWITPSACLALGGLTFVVASLLLAPSTNPTKPLFSRILHRYRYIFTIAISACAAALALPPSSFAEHPALYSPSQWHSGSRLLTSQLSNTGRIVVGEHTSRDMQFRYLRADHSLLGGIWIGPARDQLLSDDRGRKWGGSEELERAAVDVAESIYSTFLLQEAVRLADPTSHTSAPHLKQGLIIGLGAGLAARALHEHNVNLTIAEIDPVVYDYARRFFGVKEPRGGVYLEDARALLRRETDKKYDYVIHDVFTGGSVPSSLFTMECLADISRSLSPTGVVAINYAGDSKSLASRMIFTTILSSFAHCRAFEDGAHRSDYKNLVFFCSPTSPVVFRKPVSADYLSTVSPRMTRKVLTEFETAEMNLAGLQKAPLVRDGNVKELEKAQRGGIQQHWELMSSALPLEVWAMY